MTNKQSKLIQIKCEGCLNIFYDYKCNDKQYCSFKCWRQSRTQIKNCLTCNIEIFGPNWIMENKKYCSNKCSGVSRRGDNNPAKRPESKEKISKALKGRGELIKQIWKIRK